MSKLIHIILSGGVGSRLWPLSRKSMPKQYLPMFGGKSLFQLTAERSKGFADRVVVVGNRDNYTLSKAELIKAEIDDYGEIVEAMPRNTAAAIAFASLDATPNDILLVTPSDHIITDEISYLKSVKEAIALAADGSLVTFGVTPTKAETGYGYIEHEGNEVISFREKPELSEAKIYLDNGQFLWNSGIFCFKASTFLLELSQHEPEILSAATLAYESMNDRFLPEFETSLIPNKSIDYAVLEKSDKIKVVKADFGWSDLGSFESIWDYLRELGEDSPFIKNNCVIGSQKHVEFLGVENLMLVETNDAILILDKSKSQDVKRIYEELEKFKPELIS